MLHIFTVFQISLGKRCIQVEIDSVRTTEVIAICLVKNILWETVTDLR